MQNKDKAKLILEQLKGKEKFTRRDFDKAVMLSLDAVDKRTHDRWFDYFWSLEYFEQPYSGIYKLNGK